MPFLGLVHEVDPSHRCQRDSQWTEQVQEGTEFAINRFSPVTRLAWLGKVILQPLDPTNPEATAYLFYSDFPGSASTVFGRPCCHGKLTKIKLGDPRTPGTSNRMRERLAIGRCPSWAPLAKSARRHHD